MSDRSNLARSPQPVRERPTPASSSRRPTPRPAKLIEKGPDPRTGDRVALIIILGFLAFVNAIGFEYYSSPASERVRSPWHVWLRPSGYIGQTAGILALLVFVFLWLYPLRKKYKSLAWTGTVGRWLDIHILTALGMPLLLTIHMAWHARGLIGLGFASMMVVVASGVVGRYLYMRIPRSMSGVALTLEEVGTRRKAILEQISEGLGLEVAEVEKTLAIHVPPMSKSILGGFMQLLTADYKRWLMARRLRNRWKAMLKGGSFTFRVNRQKRRVSEKKALDEAVVLATREMELEQQARMLGATNRIFAFWHVAHRPFAITAAIAVVVHVAVVVALGQTWFR